MIKTTEPDSQPGLHDGPQLEEIKFASAGLRGDDLRSFVKRASHQFVDWLRSNPPKSGETYAHLHAMGSTEMYGCFFAGAPVQTSTGLKPIEQIRVGDEVLTHKNRYRKVTATFTSPYTGKRVALKASGLPEAMVCTAEHPVWVVRGQDFDKNARCEAYLARKGATKVGATDAAVEKAQFVRADTLKKGDFLVIPIKPVITGPTEVKTDPYLLGVYLAEGCISREYRDVETKGKPRRVILSLHKYDDVEILRYVEGVVDSKVYVSQSLTSEKGIRVEISNNTLAAECAAICGTESTAKRVPPVVFAQTREWKLQFLAGYLDGDGCVVTTGVERGRGTITASTASLNLVLDLHRLLASVGIAGAASKGWNRQKNGCFGSRDRVIYTLNIGGGYTAALLDGCKRLKWDRNGKTIKKQGAAQIGSEHMLVPLTSVLSDDVTDETKFNFEVEEDNSYVVYSSVHNCNRNHDGYSHLMLRRDTPTFEKYANWFLNHRNQDPTKGYGKVKKAWYNEEMQRTELLVALNATKEAAERNGGLVAEKTLQKMASGQDVAVSQSCKISHDVCVLCGNKARTRAEYCTPKSEGGTCKYAGCKYALGRVYEDGAHQFVDNPHCTFFDISDVSDTRGADRTAFITGKVAGNFVGKIGGAELSEILGLVAPEYLLDGNTISAAGCLRKLASVGSHPPARAWSDCLAVREWKKTAHSRQAPVFQGGSAERHETLAELGAAGVILPPAQWLSAVTGSPVEKCARVFAKGVDVGRDLLDRIDLHDVLATQSLQLDDNRLSNWSREKYAWMAPTNKDHVRESIRASVVLANPDPAYGSDVPEAVRKEAAAAYLAYQGRILAFHENSANFHLLLSECARHNLGKTT